MLNLMNPIVFTNDEQSTINKLTSYESGDAMWKDNSIKNIKHRISEFTIKEQKCRCAYCECLLVQGTTAIEHIAPKSKYRQFTFEPLNLISVCGRCNSVAIKGQKDTIIPPLNMNYRQNSFSIIHPYLDNPDNEICFIDTDRIVFDKQRCSPKGLETIAFFHWEDEDAIYSRSLNSIRKNVPKDIVEYAALVSTYKP